MKIGVVQMEVYDGEPERNRSAVKRYLDASPHNDLCLLPELWTSGYVHELWGTIARDDTPLTLRWMKQEAMERSICLGGSVIALHSEGYLVNRFVLFDKNGQLVCQYDKAHLFKPLHEDACLRRGTELPPVVVIQEMRVSPAICYDLRFPEMFRRVALQGVDLFLVSSQWPVPRQHVLRVLSESRAIENQAILALSNRIGEDGRGNCFCGGSGIFSPNGPLADARQTRGVTAADVDVQCIDDSRRFLDVFSDRIKGIDC